MKQVELNELFKEIFNLFVLFNYSLSYKFYFVIF